MKHMLLKTQGLILLLLLSFSVSAATLPSYYPKPLPPMIGKIDGINIKKGEIIIDDIPFKLSMNVKVHSLTTEFSSLQVLRNGMHIAHIMKNINGTFTIAEIWILPSAPKR